MKEFVIAGLLISPFVRYALIAAILFVPIHMLLVACGFRRWFWHPLLAELALYVCLVSILNHFV